MVARRPAWNAVGSLNLDIGYIRAALKTPCNGETSLTCPTETISVRIES